MLAASVALGAALAWGALRLIGAMPWAAALGTEPARIDTLEAELRVERGERTRLEAIANAADSQIKVEREAAERLARQVRELELDNARLKADLTYLENLLPAGDGETGLAIRGLRVESDATQSQLNVRALLTQGGRSDRDFVGSLQLVLQVTVQGRAQTLTVPEPGAPAALRETLKLSFRRAHRVQAVIPLPPGATVRSAQLRVLEGGVVRAQQTAMP